MPVMEGDFPRNDKLHPNWHWKIYADPGATATGYTRKLFDPRDTSNGGKPQEYFDTNYDFAADQRDEQIATSKAAAKAQQAGAVRTAQDQRIAEAERLKSDQYTSGQQYRDTQDAEKVRQFDVGAEQTDQRNKDLRDQVKNALKQQQYEFTKTNEIAARRAAVDEGNLEVNRGHLGADILKTGIDARGALDWAQGDAYAQGVSGSNLAPFVSALQGIRPVAYGGGTATQGNPVPLSVGTMANRLTNGATGVGAAAGTDAYGRPLLSPTVQQGVDAADKVYQGGLANVPQGFFENMTDDQRKAFTSAGDWLGRNTGSELEYWKRSRATQGSALAG